ncbi:MAG TPA: phenylalanine--tRNA ligase subunit beta, partial [Solirubrobacteraceae bacterium]|nr:phenylalanine--tRNA ligase subunit beta [Solirubrobacteraceae bacterium]
TSDGLIAATALLIELCGATLRLGTIDVGGPGPDPEPIALRPRRVGALLGSEIAPARCREILESLEFAVGGDGETLRVSVPYFRRRDVQREVDLIEEIARIDGLDRLPATLPPRTGAAGRLTPAQRLRRQVEDALAARGLVEVVGWSFADPHLLERLRLPAGDPLRNVVTIENPLSESLSIMRPTLLGSLLDAARANAARGAGALRLFESGTVYRAAAELADEHHAVGALLTGAGPDSWRGEPGPADFYAAKALLEAVIALAGIELELVAEDFPWLHPGRCATVTAGATRVGFIGELHPQVAASWDLGQSAAWAIDLDRLAALAPDVARFEPFSAYPPVREDIAVVLPDRVSAADAVAAIRAAAGQHLSAVELFDVYRGESIGEGRVSLAFHLEFQADDRTLTSEDVLAPRAAIERALRDLGGSLRA